MHGFREAAGGRCISSTFRLMVWIVVQAFARGEAERWRVGVEFRGAE